MTLTLSFEIYGDMLIIALHKTYRSGQSDTDRRYNWPAHPALNSLFRLLNAEPSSELLLHHCARLT